jgi:uncharacterized protein (TIGR02145 family)
MKKILIILILIGTVQISKAQTGSIIITKGNNAGTITRQIDSIGFSTIWNFTNTSTGWTSTINYTKLAPCPGTPTVYYAGQTYHTVQIGSQCWLVENLNVGTMIDSMQDQTNNGVIEKYCYGDDPANCATYGGLYQWGEAVQYKNGATNTDSANPAFSGNVQGICPSGWHIPTLNEFDTLAVIVNLDGNALKVIGQDNISTDTSGFSALLAGYRDGGGYFYGFGGYAGFWSSTGDGAGYAYGMDLAYHGKRVYVYYYGVKAYGYNVRCVKD